MGAVEWTKLDELGYGSELKKKKSWTNTAFIKTQIEDPDLNFCSNHNYEWEFRNKLDFPISDCVNDVSAIYCLFLVVTGSAILPASMCML